ncbi:MAG: hypothetical protein IPP74_10110 [Alphaproteobacteria bacterium]|nr:hypothetical protein [Alphaproteobacteria bacterium]
MPNTDITYTQDSTEKMNIKKGGRFDFTNAAGIVQVIQDKTTLPLPNIDQSIGQITYSFTIEADGQITGSGANAISRGWWYGLLVDVLKSGNGSAHAFTANIQIDQCTNYNEGGAFQGRVTNIGSQNAYASFSEGIVDDGGFITRLTGFASRIIKRAASSLAYNFFASAEGTQVIDAVLAVQNPSGLGWRRGIDFSKGQFSDAAIVLKQGQKINWVNANGQVIKTLSY